MGVPSAGHGQWGIRRVIPRKVRVNSASHQFRDGQSLSLRPRLKPFHLLLSEIDVRAFHALSSLDEVTSIGV